MRGLFIPAASLSKVSVLIFSIAVLLASRCCGHKHDPWAVPHLFITSHPCSLTSSPSFFSGSVSSLPHCFGSLFPPLLSLYLSAILPSPDLHATWTLASDKPSVYCQHQPRLFCFYNNLAILYYVCYVCIFDCFSFILCPVSLSFVSFTDFSRLSAGSFLLVRQVLLEVSSC